MLFGTIVPNKKAIFYFFLLLQFDKVSGIRY